MKSLLAGAIIAVASVAAHAQAPTGQQPAQNPPGISDAEIARESDAFINRLDSLADSHVFSFKSRMLENKKLNKYNFRAGDVPIYPDSVYQARLDVIEEGIPLDYNEYVKSFINLYTVRKRNLSERVMGLSSYYFPIFEEVFEREHLPHSFKYLAVVESALNPNAVSPCGATGIWQFMFATGRDYGMDVNYYVDERRDPYRATLAAARYFKDMYRIYGDWQLVLAAYNCGAGSVNRAIRKSGLVKPSYWDIINYLPKETRSYVPAFIAATYMMNYGPEHNLYPAGITLPYNTDTVQVHGPLGFDALANAFGISVGQLTAMNPGMKKQYVPNNSATYTLYIPARSVTTWEKNRDSLYARSTRSRKPQSDLMREVTADTPRALAATANKRNRNTSDLKDKLAPDEARTDATAVDATAQARLYYTVKRGDNLRLIADLFGISPDIIREWNHLHGSTVRMGQKMSIFVPSDEKRKYATVNNMTFAQKQAALHGTGLRPSRPEPTLAEARASKKARPQAQPATDDYTVQPGDTLWSISKNRNMSVEQIKAMNNLSDARDLRPGMVLKVKAS